MFSDFHLFDRIYDIDYEGKQDEIDRYLKMLDLDGKVSIDNGRFSTLKLSGGQRKRLALLICYLEDRPIYLFDEWAADQDPEFRKFFFYLTLLQGMRAEGKIVIAITHDDHYFDLADRLFKMDAGQLLELGNFKNKVG
ncbi:ATP-binding cassette domain-containing protein [Paenibacillus rhizoplanae]